MFFGIYQQVQFLGCILIWWVILVQKLPHLWVLRSVLLLEPFCAVSVPLGLDLVLNLEKGMCFFCVFLCLAFRETIKTCMCFWIREQKRGCVFNINQKRVCVSNCKPKTRMCFWIGKKTRMCFFQVKKKPVWCVFFPHGYMWFLLGWNCWLWSFWLSVSAVVCCAFSSVQVVAKLKNTEFLTWISKCVWKKT